MTVLPVRKKKKKKGKARDEMHVKLIVFLWRVECALSPFDWQQLFTWLCDDDFCSCCWNVSHHYRPQSFSGLQSHPDDQTIWLNMSRDCNLLNMCIYIYIYTYIRNRLVGKCSCVLFSSHNIYSALLQRIEHCSTRKSTCRFPIYIHILVFVFQGDSLITVCKYQTENKQKLVRW